MRNAFEDMAVRASNAENDFKTNVVEQFEFTEVEAEKILCVYLKVKALKLDVNIGNYKLTNGLFWDKEVMTNALNS